MKRISQEIVDKRKPEAGTYGEHKSRSMNKRQRKKFQKELKRGLERSASCLFLSAQDGLRFLKILQDGPFPNEKIIEMMSERMKRKLAESYDESSKKEKE